MKLIDFSTRDDYGKEYTLKLLTTKRYSLLQMQFDIGEYRGSFEWPYLQISMGFGKLFSFMLTVGRLSFAFDLCGRNWRDTSFYDTGGQVA